MNISYKFKQIVSNAEVILKLSNQYLLVISFIPWYLM